MLLPLRVFALVVLMAGMATAQSLPIADAGDDQVIPCALPSGAAVSFDGTASSSDPVGQPLAYQWTEGATVLSSESAPTLVLSPGVHVLTLTVSDAAGGADTDSVAITVIADVEPPVVVLYESSDELWPPNHKTHRYEIDDLVASVSDDCSDLTIDDVVFTRATSDESDNAPGDGNTVNDVTFADGCFEAFVRAERSGRGDGRVYELFLAVTDDAGNTSDEAEFEVEVPHDRKHGARDSGPETDYECTSGCASAPGPCALSGAAQVELRETRKGPTLSWQAKGFPAGAIDGSSNRICLYVDDLLEGSSPDPDRAKFSKKGALDVKSKDHDLELPALPLPWDAELRLELHDGDSCVASEFSEPKVNKSDRYKAKVK